MSVERRGPQSTRVQGGKKLPPPSGMRFSTKLWTLAERARRIRNAPLKTMVHLIDEEWLKESWKRIFKGSAAGIDHVNARMYGTSSYRPTLREPS